MKRALPLALALAFCAGEALAVTARWQRHWRRQSHAPRLPHPEILRPVDPPALPSGFVMNVTKVGDADASAPVTRPREIAERIAACWRPPASRARREITLRLQFAANGLPKGEPKVTYTLAGDVSRDALVQSIRAAVAGCAPLRFTAAFGPAIAGYPLAIRFIAAGVDRQSNTGEENGGSR